MLPSTNTIEAYKLASDAKLSNGSVKRADTLTVGNCGMLPFYSSALLAYIEDSMKKKRQSLRNVVILALATPLAIWQSY